MWQIMIGHLGHFLLKSFGQIWTQGTSRHILKTCFGHFLNLSLFDDSMVIQVIFQKTGVLEAIMRNLQK